MLLKALILACIIALVSCQTDSNCGSTSFNFYNGYGISGAYGEQLWDWEGSDFSDGTSDTFDGYLYLDLIIDNVTYSISNIYGSPIDYYCDVGTTDWNSTSYASYTYNITDTIQIFREFYAPRSSKQSLLILVFSVFPIQLNTHKKVSSNVILTCVVLATWLRVLDTVRNFGTSAVSISMTYYGNLGSDGSTTFAVLNDYYWVR